MIKKRISTKIADVPVFLTGDFSPQEIVKFKEDNVKSFLSIPLNPIAFYERLMLFFKIEQPPVQKHTPMLMDIHVKGNIITTQIEGNLEAEKLELFNYLIRCFCKEKKLKEPKMMFIVPSLYSDNITEKNVQKLFKFAAYPELTMKKHSIQILTKNKDFLKVLNETKNIPDYEIAESYFSGMSILQIDFDKKKSVPVDFLKIGSMYIFDLFDSKGRKHVPALTPFSEEMKEKLNLEGISHLTYFNDKNIVEVKGNPESAHSDVNQKKLFDFITNGFEPIETELHAVKVWDEKQTLFFKKMKGQNILVMSNNGSMSNMINETLGIYFNINKLNNINNLSENLEEKHYSVIFLDSSVNYDNRSPFEVLRKIRTSATRRKTSVIILAKKIDKTSVVKFKNCGTDNILLYPFSTNKILNTVFNAVNSDRET